MTKEDAVNLAGETKDNLETVSLVIDIYDDFESRTCEKCKYSYESHKGYDYKLYKCNKGVIESSFTNLGNNSKFSCNKYEAKDK